MQSYFPILRSAAIPWLGFAVCLVTLATAGCDSKTSDTTTPGDQIAVADEQPVDPSTYPVPAGTAEEVYAFMQEVVSREPRGATDEEQTEDLGRQMDARIKAAERLEEIAEADDQLVAAKHAKLESLRVLHMIGREGGRENFNAFADSLAADDSQEIARLGRIGKFQSQLDGLVGSGKGDSESIVKALQALLDGEPPARRMFEVANETAIALQQVGFASEARSVIELIGKNFADSEESDIAEAAQSALAQSRMSRVLAEYQKAIVGEAGAEASLLEAVEAALEGDTESPAVLESMLQITQNLEFSGNVGIASKLYERLDALSKNVTDDQLKQSVQEIVEGGLQRVGLVGGPFEIIGQTVDGEEFSWSDYKGKVVLVDFWATWCGPCIAEVPNLRKNYERYHEDGFEIVGLNLDQEQDRVAPYLEKNQLPWETVLSADPDALGFGDPNAVRYRVQGIPFLVLVGRDGNVDALHLRGELLNKRLEELFSDVVPGDAAESVDDDSAVDEPDMTEAAEQIAVEESGEVEMEVSETEQPREEEDVELEETETLPPTDPPQQVAIEVNPYLADRELTGSALLLYLLELSDKSKSIRARPGFRDAIVDAADRILAESANAKHRRLAAQKKLEFLHRDACLGDETASANLTKFLAWIQSEMPDAMAEEIQFLTLEQQALQPQAAEVDLIAACCEYLETQAAALDHRHLRLASSTVEMINRLPAEDREPHFERLSQALLVSKTRDVSRYGKRLAGKPPSETPLVGKELALKGITVDGNAFDIEHYRQEIVVVDFWATWCGPCRKAHPVLVALGEKHEALRIVGVSLDADEKALAEYLEAEEVPGVTLYGNEAQKAADNYSIRALPTFLVVDTEGKIQAVTNRVDELDELVTPLLETRLSEK